MRGEGGEGRGTDLSLKLTTGSTLMLYCRGTSELENTSR